MLMKGMIANMEERKIGFFKRMFRSIKDFDEYKEYAIEKTGTSIKYFLKLMIVFSLIISIAMAIRFYLWMNDGADYIRNNLANFELKDGKLSVEQEEPIIIENENSPFNIILIDTRERSEEEKNEQIEKVKSYTSGILLTEDQIMLKMPFEEQGQTESWYSYEALGTGDMTKETLLANTTTQNIIYMSLVFYLGTLVYLFIMYAILALLDVILLAILGFIVSRILRIPLRFAPTWNIAVYALTLPILLNALYIFVNVLFGIEIKYFGVMYNAISYIYMITAILLIKSDIIKRNMEVSALVQEQEKVKQELEKQREEEEKRKQEEEKEKQKEKEKKEEKGDSPEGSKA